MQHSNEIQQKSAEWFKLRLGKFTSSEAHKLMGVKGLGKTGETYAFEKAIELLEGIDEDDNLDTWDIRRGNELEPYAFKKFKELKELEFIDVSKCSFFNIDENIGSSPDGLVDNDAVLEIKCPRREKFYKIVSFGIDEVDKEYLFQVQHQMWVTNRQKAYFMNYLIENGAEKWHIIEIERDDSIIDLMKERTKEAIILRDKFVDQLKQNRQY